MIDLPTSALARSIASAHGEGRGTPGIFKRLRSISQGRYLATLLREYVDEVAKHAGSVARFQSEDPSYAERVVEGKARQRPGLDYRPSTEGTVRIKGYLRQALLESGDLTAPLPPKEQMNWLIDWWLRRREGSKRLAHHFVFSLDPRSAATIGALGVPIDDVLDAASTDAMYTFNQRYHPDSSIGWVLGFHHDRHHVHAHALVYPVTSSGEPLNFSDSSQVVLSSGKRIRVDFLSALGRAYSSGLPHYINQAQASAFRDREKRRALIQFQAYVLSHSIAKYPEERRPLQLAELSLREWEIIATARPTELTDDDVQTYDATPADAAYFLDKVKLAGEEADKDAASIRKTRERLTRQFAEVRASAGKYVMRRVGNSGPLFRPGGEKRTLGLRTTAPGKMAWDDVRMLLASRLAHFDNLVAAQRESARSAPMLYPDFQRRVAMYDQMACLMGHRLGRWALPNWRTPKRVLVDDFLAAQAGPNSLEETREVVLADIRAAAVRNAEQYRPTTDVELEHQYRRRHVDRILGGSNQEEEVRLNIPRDPYSIQLPATANFISRDANAVGLRDLTTMYAEIEQLVRQATERLSHNRSTALPSDWS